MLGLLGKYLGLFLSVVRKDFRTQSNSFGNPHLSFSALLFLVEFQYPVLLVETFDYLLF
jgi:hypothetical protein